MHESIKVLLADPSIVMRQMVADTIRLHDKIEIVKQAGNGTEAIEALLQSTPDVVVLEVDMPVRSGSGVVEAITNLNPDIPIIMFSPLTYKGSEATLSALKQGACDYVTKPPLEDGKSLLRSHVNDHLIPKIISWGKKRKSETRSRDLQIEKCQLQLPQNRETRSTNTGTIEIIAVGCSTGGPAALKEFLLQFRSDFKLPIVVVQHMLPDFIKPFAERLDSVCHINVSQAKAGCVLEPGTAWIAPGDYHLKVERQRTNFIASLDQNKKENYCRPAVDVLFRSVAQVFGSACLGVILTGMGKDGLMGCQAIHESGGIVIAQDECSSSVWGMPRAVVDAELASCILPPQALAQHVLEVTARKQTLHR